MAKRDPRDIAAPPTAFGDGSLSDKGSLRPISNVGDGVRHGRLYWLYGASPDPLFPSEVPDPPCSGWSSVFVLDETEHSVRLFTPTTMQSWVVSRGAYELQSLHGAFSGFDHRARDAFMESLPRLWATLKIRGGEHDFATAERVMRAVGCEVPTEDQWRSLAGAAVVRGRPKVVEEAPRGGKPPAPASAGAAKPVKRAGRKGEVLAFFMEKDSINEAMAKFSVTRSNLLSQLFLLRRDHGIGYEVSGDVARIALPEGVTDPFESAEAA